MDCYAQYTPPTPTRLNSTVALRRRGRCVLGYKYQHAFINNILGFHLIKLSPLSLNVRE